MLFIGTQFICSHTRINLTRTCIICILLLSPTHAPTNSTHKQEPESHWRTCIIGIPGQILQGASGSSSGGRFCFRMRMQMQRVASGGGHTISHRIDFADESHPPATGFVCITAQDIVSVVVGAGACKCVCVFAYAWKLQRWLLCALSF